MTGDLKARYDDEVKFHLNMFNQTLEESLEYWTGQYPLDDLTLITGTPGKRITENALEHIQFDVGGLNVVDYWICLKEKSK